MTPVMCCLSALSTPAIPVVKNKCKQLSVMLQGEPVCNCKLQSPSCCQQDELNKGLVWRCIFTRYHIFHWCIVEVYCVMLPIYIYAYMSS